MGGGGGGGAFGPRHQTGIQNSRTLSPGVSKISDFSFCLLDTLWRNFRQIDLPGGLLQSFFEQEVMKNKGYEQFFLFKMAGICRGYNLGSGNNCWP